MAVFVCAFAFGFQIFVRLSVGVSGMNHGRIGYRRNLLQV